MFFECAKVRCSPDAATAQALEKATALSSDCQVLQYFLESIAAFEDILCSNEIAEAGL